MGGSRGRRRRWARETENRPDMGAWNPFAETMRPAPECVTLEGITVRRGSRVQIAPVRRSDILDLVLTGQTARVEAIEQDLDGRIQLAVILDADPGRELGAIRQPGHRFFFAPEELKPLDAGAPLAEPRILIAGIGNVFLGDDGFGVELAGRLAAEAWPEGVAIRDYGIRGFDLALSLLEPWDRIVLLDAAPRGGAPGTVYWARIATGDFPAGESTEPHALTPSAVLRLAARMGTPAETVWLAGCEPLPPAIASEAAGGAERPGLSGPARAALSAAAALVRRRVEEWRGEWLCGK